MKNDVRVGKPECRKILKGKAENKVVSSTRNTNSHITSQVQNGNIFKGSKCIALWILISNHF